MKFKKPFLSALIWDFRWILVRRTVNSYSSISKYFLSERTSITTYSGAYGILMMMKSWRKRYRNTYRNLGFGVLAGLALLILTAFPVTGQSPPADEARNIQLVVRGDDMGISQAVNQAIIDCYKNGIETSVELLVPGPWFLEAVEMLKENPGLDVGIHLTLTSEWELLKWRPVTDCPSLIDSNGYFFPVIWPGEDFSQDQALRSQSWDIVDVEKELRGQIELALKHLPDISHISGHMGFQSMSP